MWLPVRDRAVAFVQERLDAQQAVHGYEVDDAARGVIIGAGYGDYILHRTGHSLGWLTHFLGVNIDNMETRDQRRSCRVSCLRLNQESTSRILL
ncbi:MAG: hypothetical protein R2867_13920 [Caldilineaceae bacterium]